MKDRSAFIVTPALIVASYNLSYEIHSGSDLFKHIIWWSIWHEF